MVVVTLHVHKLSKDSKDLMQVFLLHNFNSVLGQKSSDHVDKTRNITFVGPQIKVQNSRQKLLVLIWDWSWSQL
ncbi:hypothetical protein D3C80_1954440 [compost metagenome]